METPTPNLTADVAIAHVDDMTGHIHIVRVAVSKDEFDANVYRTYLRELINEIDPDFRKIIFREIAALFLKGPTKEASQFSSFELSKFGYVG